MDVDKHLASLREEAETAARTGETVEVEIAPSGTAWSATVRFLGADRLEEIATASAGTPELARQSVSYIIAARLLNQRAYGPFARTIYAAIKERFPKADTIGNETTSDGFYLWNLDGRRAQLQPANDERSVLSLWADRFSHRAILQGYDEQTRDQFIEAISAHLAGNRA